MASEKNEKGKKRKNSVAGETVNPSVTIETEPPWDHPLTCVATTRQSREREVLHWEHCSTDHFNGRVRNGEIRSLSLMLANHGNRLQYDRQR